MGEDYLLNFILASFSKTDEIKIAQLIHILNGKRTPSIFYLALKKDLVHIYGLLPYLKRQQLTSYVTCLEESGALKRRGEAYLLTVEGEGRVRYFLKNYPYPKHIKDFSHSLIRLPLWKHIQLFTQIVSHRAYQQLNFTPLIRDIKIQENIRYLLKTLPKFLFQHWAEEQISIFRGMDKHSADFLANQLSGYRSWGVTGADLEEVIPSGVWGIHIGLHDSVEEYRKIAKDQKLPLHQKVSEWINQTYHEGLSPSTYQTVKYLSHGWTLEQIAKERHLKLNTIREHVLEAAFCRPEYPYHVLIPDSEYRALHRLFDHHPALTYKEASEQIEGLVFMHYRLVELERWFHD